MTEDTSFLYFAYGSNMLSRRLRATDRAPSAWPLGVGYVAGRRLTFDKVGKDGSGKCDMEAVSESHARVYGVLFRVSATDRPALDRVESLGIGYRAEQVDVLTPTVPYHALTYTAIEKCEGLRPYPWYRDIVIAGAVEHRLPRAYLEYLHSVPSTPDSDDSRQQRYERLFPEIVYRT